MLSRQSHFLWVFLAVFSDNLQLSEHFVAKPLLTLDKECTYLTAMTQKPLVLENILRAADTNRKFSKCENVIIAVSVGGYLLLIRD